jgi:hypothetical protein
MTALLASTLSAPLSSVDPEIARVAALAARHPFYDRLDGADQ